ncbi:MAG: SpoIID/LytB domain-containing protein [Acidobacteria bacterium]|nr:MAG: SpoIID/LytB domain-containing protein [Acidobacteriota bacterium]
MRVYAGRRRRRRSPAALRLVVLGLLAALVLAGTARDDAAPAAGTAAGTAPVMLRVGLATDLESVTLCCDRRVVVEAGAKPFHLERPLRVTPAGALRGRATYRLQVAALKDEQQARQIAAYLRRETGELADVVFDADRDLYRVRWGRFPHRDAAAEARGRLAVLGVEEAWVVGEGGALEGAALRLEQGGRKREIEGRWLTILAPPDVGIPFARRRYRTRLLIHVNDRGRLNVINELSIEDYLRGVVPREMGPELYDKIEALKAQSVAARTFTVRNLGEFREEGYDICSTPRCQVYGGMDVEHPLSDQAVRATAGQVLLYDGEPVETLYSATCGGHTENVEVVFPLKRGPHLRGVPCLEAGVFKLAGDMAAGTPFATGLSRRLLPTLPGTPAQVLAARLEHLALLAGLRVPHDELASLRRREVRRYLLSVLDMALDPRFLADGGELQRLVAQPPASWGDDDRRFAVYLARSRLLAEPRDAELSEAEADDLLLQLSLHLGVLRRERAVYLAHDERQLELRRDGRAQHLLRPPSLATFRRQGDRLVAGTLELMAGDPLELYWQGDDLLAIVLPNEPSPVHLGSRNARGVWQEVRTLAQMRSSVQARYPGFPFEDLQILSRGVSGRVGKLRLLGSDGRSLLVEGLAVRWTLDLPDTWFEVERRPGPSWRFRGRGWGHGVGLCQSGTYGMAARGASYRDILAHYYTGVELGRIRVGAGEVGAR